MKKFFKKRWHSVPIGLLAGILSVCLVAGSVFAAYGFWSATADVTVLEALEVQVNGDDNTWISGDTWATVPNGYNFTIPDAHPGEFAPVQVKVLNDGHAPLTATLTYSITGYPDGGFGKVTVVSAWTAGDVVSAGGERMHTVNVTVLNDAPPGEYTVALTFNRS